jgi:hypothetical protein
MLALVFIISGCSTETSRVSGTWKKEMPLKARLALKSISDNNVKIKSFVAKFYLTESKKRMALSGQLYFNSKNNNFFFTLTDVLVKSKVLSMKKYNNRVLIVFHRENNSYVENASSLDLSKYKFDFSLNDLVNLISLKIPFLDYEKALYNTGEGNGLGIRVLKGKHYRDLFIDETSLRVKKISYKRGANIYSINYISYVNSGQGFYYPETVKILNYTIRQRILIKIESIVFTDTLPDKVFKF